MLDGDQLPRWYALRTRSRHEKQVRDRLAAQGVERLLPTVTRLSQWKDRKKAIELPLFAGYCFARFSWRDRMSVLMISGVVTVVGSGTNPEPITEEEIEGLQRLVASPLPYSTHPYLRKGMAVKVIRGPLEGVRGIFLRQDKRCRLVISVHLIKQAAAVEIDAGDVIPVDPKLS